MPCWRHFAYVVLKVDSKVQLFSLNRRQYGIFNTTSNSNLEVRSVINFVKNWDIRHQKVWNDGKKTGLKCSKVLVFKWHRRFQEGRVSLDDDTFEGKPAMCHVRWTASKLLSVDSERNCRQSGIVIRNSWAYFNLRIKHEKSECWMGSATIVFKG